MVLIGGSRSVVVIVVNTLFLVLSIIAVLLLLARRRREKRFPRLSDWLLVVAELFQICQSVVEDQSMPCPLGLCA